jgi:hypothetical protein
MPGYELQKMLLAGMTAFCLLGFREQITKLLTTVFHRQLSGEVHVVVSNDL